MTAGPEEQEIFLHPEELNMLENGHPLTFGEVVIATHEAAEKHGLLAHGLLRVTARDIDQFRAGMAVTVMLDGGIQVYVRPRP